MLCQNNEYNMAADAASIYNDLFLQSLSYGFKNKPVSVGRFDFRQSGFLQKRGHLNSVAIYPDSYTHLTLPTKA